MWCDLIDKKYRRPKNLTIQRGASMYLDEHGLPTQRDGDKNDQLQRVSMVAIGEHMTKTHSDLGWDCLVALAREDRLQPSPGVYVRHVGSNPNNVSADQLISVLAYWIASGNTKQALFMLGRMMLRFGFAQNYKDGLDGTERTSAELRRGCPVDR